MAFRSLIVPPTFAPPSAPAPSPLPQPPLPQPPLWFAFRDDRILVEPRGEEAILPAVADLAAFGTRPVRRQFLGILDGQHAWSAELPPDAPAPPGMAYLGLRELYGKVPPERFWVACRAVQIKDWDRNHQFCGRCGSPMQPKPEERVKACPQCGLQNYPRISPAVIVAVTRGDRLLLARARRFASCLYSVIAGFVEPGETLEECVHREVEEETGIRVQNIRYFGSQPWPFPDSLMIAFTAEHAGGELRLDGAELVDAGWFRAGELPDIPGPISIARRLIDHFVERSRG